MIKSVYIVYQMRGFYFFKDILVFNDITTCLCLYLCVHPTLNILFYHTYSKNIARIVGRGLITTCNKGININIEYQ